MKNKKGFTIMELMVVIAIIGVITAIATPSVIRWFSNQKFNSAVRDVQSSIEGMRQYAAKENSAAVISFTSGDDKYETLRWQRGIGTGSNAYTFKTHNLPKGVTIGTTLDVEFSSRGTAQFSFGTSTGTVTINGATGLSNSIQVSLTGSSRIL